MADALPTTRDLLASGFIRPPTVTGSRSLRRIVTLAGLCLLVLPLQLVHRLCLALDHLLFPGFRSIDVTQPLFIIGPPRSGTTFLHRLMVEDPRFTTFYLWELLLAPAICQKLAFLALWRLDGWIGHPGRRILVWAEKRLFRDMATIHPTSLLDAEEDYFGLLPIASCFLLVVPFPDCAAVWRLTRFDSEVSAEERQRLLQFYRGLLQRHLWVRGPDRRMVSKNPSFCGMIRSLSEAFPSAQFAVPIRTPLETVPSLLSSMQDGAMMLGYSPRSLEPRFTRMMQDYYDHIRACMDLEPERLQVVPYRRLVADPQGVRRHLMGWIGWIPEPPAADRAEGRARRGTWKSRHRYALEDFGLSSAELRRDYDWLWTDSRFGLQGEADRDEPGLDSIAEGATGTSSDGVSCGSGSSVTGERSCC